MNVPPKCHQDDVINTLIQPGNAGLKYGIQVPATEPPGLYWYHPHVHGFTEFQVNGGAAGALIVEGMEKFRPEVAGLAERVFVIRQQYLVPWVPGPYQLTINYQVAPLLGFEPDDPDEARGETVLAGSECHAAGFSATAGVGQRHSRNRWR